MRRRRLGLLGLCLALALVPLAATAQGSGSLFLVVSDMPDGGAASLSVDFGSFTFDATAVEITGITGLNGFTVLSSDFDNATGEGGFALVNTTGGVVDGPIARIDFAPAGGSPGASLAFGGVTVGDADNNDVTAGFANEDHIALTTRIGGTGGRGAGGGAESTAAMVHLANLVSRTRDADAIVPGMGNAIVAVVALCDGSVAQPAEVRVLPTVTSAVPALSGGLAEVPCLRAGGGGDGVNTAINAALLRFSGPGAQAIGTVRLWADLCGSTSTTRGGVECLAGGYSDRSGGDGLLFQPGELIQQRVAVAADGDALALFGRTGGQILTTGSGVPVMALDPLNLPDPTAVHPTLLVFTADIDFSAAPGPVDVDLTLFTGNDSAQGVRGVCVNGALGVFYPVSVDIANCASQLLKLEPLADRFVIVGPQASGAAPAVQAEATSTDVQFVATGQDVQRFGVRVFNLAGRRVWEDGMAATRTLRWDLTTARGAPVANGVYLYRATVKTGSGETVRTPVRKLVVMR